MLHNEIELETLNRLYGSHWSHIDSDKRECGNGCLFSGRRFYVVSVLAALSNLDI